ncbi:hypothetical protein CDL15_Pgr013987 [Punica granatum]|uniref:Malectin-like domain-containing protein n=1 Tax=Punica granatum TaxID=22663 RepID=A0A218WA41_PUNGR|nr:hypothetical protein CDL15_Pgr013987 [Punica granatum]
MYTDENSIPWTGDADFMQIGFPKVVPSINVNDNLPLPMRTLRVFPNSDNYLIWKKYCYSIDIGTAGSDLVRILVRASFYYGNYDGLSNPPSFELMFDGNYWTKVQTTLDNKPLSYETIYVVKAKATNICIAQREPGMNPFISTLEVCRLRYTMYNAVPANYALFAMARGAFGSNKTIRYPDDTYDRIWFEVPSANAVTSDAPSITTGTTYNEPPMAIMQKAITGSNLSFWVPDPSAFNVYMYLYFSEVTSLSAGETRSFLLYRDKILMSAHRISPPYESVLELSYTNLYLSNDTKFYLVPTANSTLPPILNAMETYSLSQELNEGTDPNDVQGLEMLKKAYSVLRDWTGDPCRPSSYSWIWISCDLNADPPRVTALDLSDNDLCGPVPSSIKSSNNYRLQQGNPNIGKSCSPGSNGKDATDTEVKIKIRETKPEQKMEQTRKRDRTAMLELRNHIKTELMEQPRIGAQPDI